MAPRWQGLLRRTPLFLALAFGFALRGAWAQTGDTGSAHQGDTPGSAAVGPQMIESQPATAAGYQDVGGVPVNERSFQEGTVILPADHLFGDWFGRLPVWEESGFKPTLSWVTNFGGNVVGGRDQGFTECENLGLDLAFDLEKCMGICDTYFHVSLSQRSGESVTNEFIGNVFSTQQVFGGETFKLVNVELQRYFCDRNVDVKLGRIAPGDDFLVSPFFWGYMSGGINGQAGISFDAPGWSTYPYATWGTRIRAKTSDRTYAMVGFYNGDPDIRDNDSHGCDFSLHGPLFAMGEVGYQRNGHRDDPGMLGDYKLGAFFNGGSFDRFSRSQFAPGIGGGRAGQDEGNWGYYALFDQVICQPCGKDNPRATGIFGSIIVAPESSINQIPFCVTGGIVDRGRIPCRPEDSLWFGVVYGKFSDDLQDAQERAQILDPTVGVQESELVFEWAYRFRMHSGAMFFQPDLQYIINPGGAHQYSNALQVGAQAGINF
jgi:porin